MPSLGDVFRTLNEMQSAGVIRDYAIGGGMAALFYAEALATFDIDVFALIPAQSGSLISLADVYAWCRQRGFGADREHVVIHGVPVQFLAANEGIEKEAMEQARSFDYEEVAVRVMEPEYLAVLSVLTGGPKRRERTATLFEAEVIDREKLRAILGRYHLAAEWRERWGQDG